MQKTHPYHILELSPLPILTTTAIFLFVLGLLGLLKQTPFALPFMLASTAFLLHCMYKWWHAVVDEGFSHHNKIVQHGFKLGVIGFIATEVMFFFTFFWSILKTKIAPVGILEGPWVTKVGDWLPESFKEFDIWNVPLMNTLILLLSGTMLTWAHDSLRKGDRADFLQKLSYTIGLGLIFTILQAFEYIHAPFALKDSVYTSNFYIATGFHGVHVIIGTIFLFVCYLRGKRGDFDGNKTHLGLEFASWYWHFVDVVWLFLFVCLYIFA